MTFSNRTLLSVLAGSLALNLFFGGFFVARGVRAKADAPSPGPLPMLFNAEQALGDPSHPALRKLMRDHRAALQSHRHAIGKARRQIRDAMRADPFDPARLDSALASLRTETTDSQAELHRALLELASGMTPQQRVRLTTALDSTPPGRRHRPGAGW